MSRGRHFAHHNCVLCVDRCVGSGPESAICRSPEVPIDRWFSLPFLLTLSPQVRKRRVRFNHRFRLHQHFRMVIEVAFSLTKEVAGLKISLALGVSDLSFYLV